jgi:hypothetical protein
MEYVNLLRILNEKNTENGNKLKQMLVETNELNDFLLSLDSDQRQTIIDKIKRFAESDAKEDIVEERTEHFLPKLNKFDFVHCNFTGVGFEWDGPHYALIWELNPKFDSVMVIPTTSQKRKEFANVIEVGTITGLPNKTTTLLVSDMTRVSRRRLTPVNFIHPKKGQKRSALPKSWSSRINDAIVVTYAGELTLGQYIINKCSLALPADINILFTRRFKPIRGYFDGVNLKFRYRNWNEDNYHIIDMVNPNRMMTLEEKESLVNNLLSIDDQKRTAAEEKYQRLYKST